MPIAAAAPHRPRGLSPGHLAALAAACIVALAACGSSATLAPAPSSGPDETAGAPSATVASTPTASPAKTPPASPAKTPRPTKPPPTPTDEPTASPGETPTEPASPSASPSAHPSSGSAGACTGTSANRDFYVALADAVAWDVYCAVLPTGWHVDTGDYHLSKGGQLDITYKGPNGARLELQEGAFCGGADGCLPAGGTPGSASFGGRDARLVDLGGGKLAVVTGDPGIAWQATGTNLDAATLTGFTAALALVAR